MSDQNEPYSPDKFAAPPFMAHTETPREAALDEDEMPVIPSYGLRFLARLIDTLFGLGLGFVVGLGVAGSGLYSGRSPMAALPILMSLIGPILYETASEFMTGATIGKLLCGMRVQGERGGSISLGSAFIRSLVYLLDAFCMGLVAYQCMSTTQRRQRLGDQWAHTVVVKKTAETPPTSPLGVFVGVALWGGCIAISLVAH